MPHVSREEEERLEYERHLVRAEMDALRQTVQEQQEKLEKYDRFVAVLKAAKILSNDQEIAVMKAVRLI